MEIVVAARNRDASRLDHTKRPRQALRGDGLQKWAKAMRDWLSIGDIDAVVQAHSNPGIDPLMSVS
ncbi:MAG: hypothetical protein DMG36_14770 [Acidobacteria bacterium]|nr:MAG: hypothetical protein DMG36_14770 [Acidobacteriota bacterium]